MDSIPIEVLCFIVREVPGDSLENLRLVNRTLASEAAPRLFEVIPVWIGLRSLEKLAALSEHPQLSQYPKEVVFSPIRFIIDHGHDDFYRAKVQEWSKHQPSPLNSHTLATSRHKLAYRSYIEAQRYLSRGEDVSVLARAFTNLPNLETLHLDHGNLAVGSLELMNAFGRFVTDELVTYDCKYSLPTLIRALSFSRTKFKIFKLGPGKDPHYANGRDLSETSRARSSIASLAHEEPRRITVDAFTDTFCATYDDHCHRALSMLRELRIGDISVCSSDVAALTSAIHMMIESAPDIETIVINDIDLHHTQPRPSLTTTIPTYPLHKLRVLDVSNYETEIPALIDFFRHHRTSLVEVKLDSVSICSNDWSTALMRLRTINFVCLELFTLNWCDEQEEKLEVQEYILRKTDADPLVELKKYLAESMASELGQALSE